MGVMMEGELEWEWIRHNLFHITVPSFFCLRSLSYDVHFSFFSLCNFYFLYLIYLRLGFSTPVLPTSFFVLSGFFVILLVWNTNQFEQEFHGNMSQWYEFSTQFQFPKMYILLGHSQSNIKLKINRWIHLLIWKRTAFTVLNLNLKLTKYAYQSRFFLQKHLPLKVTLKRENKIHLQPFFQTFVLQCLCFENVFCILFTFLVIKPRFKGSCPRTHHLRWTELAFNSGNPLVTNSYSSRVKLIWNTSSWLISLKRQLWEKLLIKL